MKAKKTLGMIAALAAVCTLAACASETSGAEDSSAQSVPVSYEESLASDIINNPIQNGVIVLEDGRAMNLYELNYEQGRNYAASVNKYKEHLGEYVNVYSMVIPSAAAFYMPEAYFEEGIVDREQPHIGDINDHLNGVIPIDVYGALTDHVEENIYFRTDHHWTQLGAYYAAQTFTETALVPFDDLSEYDMYSSEYLGPFYGMGEYAQHMKDNPDIFTWYVPKRKVTVTHFDKFAKNGQEGRYFRNPGKPMTWIYRSGGIARISTGLDTGRSLMMINDSFADPFAPWLFGSFDDIWMIDMRILSTRTSTLQLAKDNDITDLLFCISIDNAAGDTQCLLERIM